ncbi:MAG: MFS transporter [Desulfurococcales archaeon]|nr:MFS transporter [Desulfurococcales archaeon]
MELKLRAERIALAIIGFSGVIDTSFLLGIIAPYAVKLGASDPQAGLITGLYSMVAIPASILAGIIVDKIGRKKSLAFGLAWDSVMVYSYSLASNPLQLSVVRALHAIGGSLVYPAYLSVIGDKTEGSRSRGVVVGGYLSIVALAVAVGSLSSAVIVSTLGYHASFKILSLILLAGLISTYIVSEAERAHIEERKSIWAGLVEARGPILYGLILIFMLYMSFGMLIGGLGQALLNEGLVTEEEEASGILGAIIGISTLVSIPFLTIFGYMADRSSLRRVSVIVGLLVMLFILTTIRTKRLALLVVLFSPYGLAIALIMTLSTILVLKAPFESRGTAVALQQVSNIMGVAIGAPVAGALAEYYGLEGVALGVAIPVFIASLLAYLKGVAYIKS